MPRPTAEYQKQQYHTGHEIEFIDMMARKKKLNLYVKAMPLREVWIDGNGLYIDIGIISDHVKKLLGGLYADAKDQA